MHETLRVQPNVWLFVNQLEAELFITEQASASPDE